jgi:predicted acyl esterase
MQVKTVQYGLGEKGPVNSNTGRPACGDETLDDERLAANRADFGTAIREHPLDDDYHRDRSPDWSTVVVPLLSAGNWGGQGLHLRGNVEGYVRAAASHKWLEMHGGEHWTSFYTDYGVRLQKRFFDHFLKGEDNGWERMPPVRLQVRHVDGTFTERTEAGWPLPGTVWTRLHLDAADRSLAPGPPSGGAAVTYDAAGEGVTFEAPAFTAATEVTGPLAAKLYLSADTDDADLFLIVRVFSPDGEEVVFQGAIDPHTPVAQGWLRASHRGLDPAMSLPYRPYHPHDGREPLEPGAVTELDIEILPTCLVMPAGYRIALTVRGMDYAYPGASGGHMSNFKNELTGCGPFLHDDPADRPAERAGGRVTLHTGPGHPSHLLLPVIPDRTT